MRHSLALVLVVFAACKGSAGDPGADGASCTVTDNGDGTITVSCDDGTTVTIGGTSVTRVDEEPAGDNCEFGGTAVHTGIDDDVDGMLDDEEIDDTAYVCNGSGGTPPCTTLEGDVYLRDHVDLLVFAGLGCTSITGGLFIQQFTGSTLDGLETLTSIEGGLFIQESFGLADVSGLANVATVPALAVTDMSSLTSLAAFDLSSTDGSVLISNVPALVEGPTLSGFTDISILAPEMTSLDLGTLPDTLVELEIESSLPAVDLANVTTIEGTLHLSGNDLTTVNAPQLETAGDIIFSAPLTTLNMAELSSLIGGIAIEGTSLTTLPLGSLVQAAWLSTRAPWSTTATARTA
jgi:hypothetical protein